VRVLGGFSYSVESQPERPAPSQPSVGLPSQTVDANEAATRPAQPATRSQSATPLSPRTQTNSPPFATSEPESPSNPELDTDADGLPDAQDACPSIAGPASFERKINGCPLDRDGDGISDSQDACPEDAGPVATDPSANGCRTTALVIGEQIVIRDKIAFESGKAVIVPSSEAVLEGLASVLASHHEIARLAIEGHTDDLGPEQLNLALSQARAAAVMRWLIEHGVDERRLQASGYGSRRPLKPNSSPAEREANRRVDFQIVRRSALGKDGWKMGPLE
jgi:outer membrane protein OmpA-like peptidoglycan-associated protein